LFLFSFGRRQGCFVFQIGNGVSKWFLCSIAIKSQGRRDGLQGFPVTLLQRFQRTVFAFAFQKEDEPAENGKE